MSKRDTREPQGLHRSQNLVAGSFDGPRSEVRRIACHFRRTGAVIPPRQEGGLPFPTPHDRPLHVTAYRYAESLSRPPFSQASTASLAPPPLGSLTDWSDVLAGTGLAPAGLGYVSRRTLKHGFSDAPSIALPFRSISLLDYFPPAIAALIVEMCRNMGVVAGCERIAPSRASICSNPSRE